MFPVTSAMLPSAAYLNGDRPDADQKIAESATMYDHKLQPLYEIFEAQPVYLSGDFGETPESLEAVIVISRAVPRPTEVGASLTHRSGGICKLTNAVGTVRLAFAAS